jgi:hypothetical protein
VLDTELLDIFNSPDFRTEIHFDRFDLAAASSEEFRIAKWLTVVRLQIVEDKGFVGAIQKLANVDRPGAFAVGPATFQVRGTIDVIIVRTCKVKSSLKVDFRADRSFVSYALK